MVVLHRAMREQGEATGGRVGPPALLLTSGVVIALAILAGGQAARVLNGVGGALWVAAAAWMLWALRRLPGRALVLAVALLGAVAMAVVVRPGTYLEAGAGFFLAGLAVAAVARGRAWPWTLLVPALYFPLHIAVAIGRVVASGGVRQVRTDPPPTGALVPLVMIAAAAAAGLLADRFAPRRSAERQD